MVDIVNKQSSKDPLIMAFIRPLVFKMLEFNICFQAEHIPGVNNVLSDRISQFQNGQELLGKFKMSMSATPVPTEILPQNLDLS